MLAIPPCIVIVFFLYFLVLFQQKWMNKYSTSFKQSFLKAPTYMQIAVLQQKSGEVVSLRIYINATEGVHTCLHVKQQGEKTDPCGTPQAKGHCIAT